MSKAQVH